MLSFKPDSTSLLQAKEFADAYQTNGFGKNVLGVSHTEFISFIRIGKLCELVFAQWLIKNNIAFEAPEMLIPHPGNYKKGADLILTHSQQEVDIKAANKAFHKRILIREDQFQAHVHDIYIGAKYVSDECVQIHGYTTGKLLLQNQPKDFGYGLCRNLMLDELKSLELFISHCLNHRPID
jgi:hypothetical protein